VLTQGRRDDAALQAGIVAPALSQHRVGRRASAWSGLMLGYAQVPAEQMAERVGRLAVLIRSRPCCTEAERQSMKKA